MFDLSKCCIMISIMISRYKTILKTLLLIAPFALTSCGDNPRNNSISEKEAEEIIRKKKVEGITFNDQTFTYDGEPHSIYIEGELPTGMSVIYVCNEKTEVGNYTVYARFTNTNNEYETPGLMQATMSIVKGDYDMSGVTFEDRTYEAQEYFANYNKIKVSGILPAGVTVRYTNDLETTPFLGDHIFTASFEGSSNYNPIDPITCKVTITRGHIDLTEYTFEDETIVYDGKPHRIYLKQVDEDSYCGYGIEDIQYGEEYTEAGVYTCTAKIIANEYFYQPDDVKATLTITKAQVPNITFTDKSFINDGKTHSLRIEGELPEGISVEYENNIQSETGTYKVRAHFSGENKNYLVPDDMEANMTIIEGDYIDGNTITLGEHPQRVVTDADIIEQLDQLSPEEDSYYHLNDKKYVKQAANNTGTLTELKLSYVKGDVFYFEVEPIKWKILSDASDYIITTEKIIDSMVFNKNRSVGYIGNRKFTSSNYEISNIRAYLNGLEYVKEAACESYLNKGFIDLAFKEEEKGLFYSHHMVNKDNSEEPEYSFDVTDKIFLPSLEEMRNAEWGFSDNSSRTCELTDYARIKANSSYNKTYFTRDNCKEAKYYYVSTVDGSTGIVGDGVLNYSRFGVRPFAII